jgi:endonuclease/exonuclease/phosphatase family metal-dependent hydrolase
LTPPRTVTDSVLFTSYNVLNLYLDDSPSGREHYDLVVESIRGLDTDVLAVQEIRAPDEPTAGERLRRLAGDVGMCCAVPAAAGEPAQPVLAIGPHGYHCGLMWREGIEPEPGSLCCHGPGHFWHSLASVTLQVGGVAVRHAAHHAMPFGRRTRTDQNELVASLATSPPRIPTLIGADWNTESADRVLDEATGEWRLYEPIDPYAGVEWFGQMIHQCEWDYDQRGQRRAWADRGPGEVLWAGGLFDAAAALNAPWQASVGHHPEDPFGRHGVRRRIDAVRVTQPVVAALRGHHVEDTELTRRASDHLPVTVEYVPSAITRE